jgi:hypothetical protein
MFKDLGSKFLGSAEGCDLRIELSNIAARHARLTLDGRGLTVQDVGSETGTYINGERLAGERELRQGDRICLGPPGSRASAKLLVRLPEGGGAKASPATEATSPTKAPSDMVVDLPAPRPTHTPPPPPREASHGPGAGDQPTGHGGFSVPHPPAPAPEGRRARPEYTDELPSIASEGAREPGMTLPPLRPTSRVTRDRKPARPSVSPRFLIGGAVVLALVGASVLYLLLAKSPPVISAVTPPRVQAGQSLSIAGTDFVADPAANVVHFGDLTAKVTQATPALIVAEVPVVATSTTVSVKVRVESGGRRSNTLVVSYYAAPKVNTIEPDVALPGDEVGVKGSHLDLKPLTVLVSGVTAEVLQAQESQLRFKVPDVPVAVGKEATVVVQAAGESSAASKITIGHLPVISSIAPPQAGAAERVTITGKGFDPSPEDNLVTFDGQPAIVLQASPTQLVVSAPGLGLESQISAAVVVHCKAGQTSGQNTFLVTRPSSAAYIPRFFLLPEREHANHDHVFVANELGPVFLLTGKAEEASTAARGEKVASSMNALVASIRGTLPALEVRPAPTLCVAVQGSPTPIVTITPADVAGYEEGWGGTGAHKSTPQNLAAFWLALVQDEIALFVLHQRPIRLLEVTTRGKVLTDLYAEGAQRGGPEAGVPVSLLTPLTAATRKAFRDLALIVGEGQASAATALEGLWEGTWDEEGTGTKEIAVRFDLKGGKLGASMTTHAGGLTMDVPLTEVSYDKGVVHFLLMTGGTPSRFVGNLSNAVISGTVQGSGGKETGKFSLQFRR